MLPQYSRKPEQMKLNVDKCALLRCTRSQTPIQYVYTLIDCNLHVKRLHTYLGVVMDNTMSWSPHIQTVGNRATKVFNFISIPETIIQPTLFCLKHPLIALSTVFIQELSEIGITCQLISLNQGTWKNLLIYLTNYS